MGNYISRSKKNKVSIVAPPPSNNDYELESIDRTIYQMIININWIDESKVLKQSLINFYNLLVGYNKNINYKIGSIPIVSLIIITFLNQCLVKKQIFRGQLKMIINYLQLRYSIETKMNSQTLIYLDNKSISLTKINKQQKTFLINEMLILDLLMFISEYTHFKLASDLGKTILNIFNETVPESSNYKKDVGFTL